MHKVQIDRRKDKNGNVTLRLRWWFEGKREQLILGVADDGLGLAYAEMVQKTIARDLKNGTYISKAKYENSTKRRSKPAQQPDKITAIKLFQKYAESKLSDPELPLSHSSTVRFKGIASKIDRLLGDTLASQVTESVAKNAIARWSESASTRTIKERLFDLRACWDWGRDKYQLAESNPWVCCLDRVRTRGSSQQTKHKKPFTIAELQAVIAAFAAHPQYKHYTEFVIFLSHTACRPGEAVGLRWKHLGVDFSTASIEDSISRGHQNPKGTKNGRNRTIQLSPTVRSMLADRFDRRHPNPGDLVFPSPKGLSIDDHRFRARAWRTILASCNVEYRSPYNIRHSGISHAADRGVDLTALAEQTGHSRRVLESTYLHSTRQDCLFVDFGKPENSI